MTNLDGNVRLTHPNLSRRSFIATSALVVSGLLVNPSSALADASAGEDYSELFKYMTEAGIFDFSGLSEEEINRMLLLQAQYESSQLLLTLDVDGSAQQSIARARPGYSNVYSSPVKKSSGFRDVGNQPRDGFSYNTSGSSVTVLTSGGPSISLAFGFPAPWGTITIGVSFATYRSGAVGGYNVGIPGDGKRYKVQANIVYESTPYTVYYTDSAGKKSVYKRTHTTPSIVGRDFRAYRI